MHIILTFILLYLAIRTAGNAFLSDTINAQGLSILIALAAISLTFIVWGIDRLLKGRLFRPIKAYMDRRFPNQVDDEVATEADASNEPTKPFSFAGLAFQFVLCYIIVAMLITIPIMAIGRHVEGHMIAYTIVYGALYITLGAYACQIAYLLLSKKPRYYPFAVYVFLSFGAAVIYTVLR